MELLLNANYLLDIIAFNHCNLNKYSDTKTKNSSPISKKNYPLIPRSNESIWGHVLSSLANFQKASRPKTAIRSCDTSP